MVNHDSLDSDYQSPALTRRERDILRLMADDLSNAEIAERLVVSPGTVKWYVKQIYGKLGVHTRDEAIAAVQERANANPAQAPVIEDEASTPPHNLPALTTHLIGRQAVIDQLCGQLRDERVRLLTLIGTGGIGKTRLSIEVGTQLLEDFPGGVYLLELAPLTDASLIPGLVMQTLQIRDAVAQSVDSTIGRTLKQKKVLLIFDNFEHVLPGASLVSDILRAAPNVKVLATSREPLRLYGEVEFEVPQLSLPDRMTYEDLMDSEAVRLFVQRAQAVKPDFVLTEENAITIGQICTQLDGLPLAIELAAARIKLYTPQALLGRLNKRLSALTGGARDLAPRHQTLRSAIGWSYDLLSPQEQAVFRRLGVFSGIFGLEAAEAMCADLVPDVIDTLESLVTKSLLKLSPENADRPYFYLLETVREFALEQLTEAGEYDAACAEHAAHYARVSEYLCCRSVIDDEFGAASLELENFRSALHFYQAQPVASDHEFWLAGNVIYLLARVGQTVSLRNYGTAVLQRDYSQVSASARALVLGYYGQALCRAGDEPLGLLHIHDMYHLAIQAHFPHDVLYIKVMGIYANFALGDRPTESVAMLEALIQEGERLPDPSVRYSTISLKVDLAYAYDLANQHDRAVALRQELLPLIRSLGNHSLLVTLLIDIGMDLIYKEQYEEAVKILHEALSATERSRRLSRRFFQLTLLVHAYANLGRQSEAEATLTEARIHSRQFDKQSPMHTSMANAEIAFALSRGDYDTAIKTLRDHFGLLYPDIYPDLYRSWLSRAVDVALLALPSEQAARIYGCFVKSVEDGKSATAFKLNLPSNLRRHRQLESALGADAFAAAMQSGTSLTSSEILAMFDMHAQAPS